MIDETRYFSKHCENDEQAISSKAFFLGFFECLGKIGINGPEKEDYLSIIKKLRENSPISIIEYSSIEKLLLREDFIDIAQNHFKGLIFVGSLDDIEKSGVVKKEITIESMKIFLLKRALKNIVSSSTNDILQN